MILNTGYTHSRVLRNVLELILYYGHPNCNLFPNLWINLTLALPGAPLRGDAALLLYYFFLPEWGLLPQCVFIMGGCLTYRWLIEKLGNRLQLGYLK
jgi:hypothetical protein